MIPRQVGNFTELDHCRSLPLWEEKGPALLFVHSAHRDEPNELLDTLMMGCPGALEEKAERARKSRGGEQVPPCSEAWRGVSGINVPLPLSYVSAHKTKGMPRRLENGAEKTEMMLGGLSVCPSFSASHGNPDAGVSSPLCGGNYQRLAFDRRPYGAFKRGNDADRTEPFDTLMANTVLGEGLSNFPGTTPHYLLKCPKTRYSDDRP
ncbi:hypothetical protein QBC45DRAFT_452533 [Copromyces sp. CBS 386.78]|nr:hypothetical protein QBC45DRAFT_452533 [Copromyces sp. CBS 386.78]